MFTCFLAERDPLQLFVPLSVNMLLGKQVLMYVMYTFYPMMFDYRNSASCTHVSALQHALATLSPASFQLKHKNPPLNDSDDEDSTPVTSLPCQWRRPRKRKESSLSISKATFEKHDYAKPAKKKIKSVEDFDPRPPQFRELINSRLPDFLDKIRGEQLGISLLFDLHFRQGSVYQPSLHHTPDISKLRKNIAAFK